MISKMDKRRFIDRLTALCDSESASLIMNEEKLEKFFKGFDYKVTSLLKEFYIEYDDVYDELDKIKSKYGIPSRAGEWFKWFLSETFIARPFGILTPEISRQEALRSIVNCYKEEVKVHLIEYVNNL